MITIHPPGNAFSVWLIEHGVTSSEMAAATGYSRQAVKSWRQSHAVASSRRPQLGALVVIAEALRSIARARRVRKPSLWQLSPDEILSMILTPAKRTP